MAVLWVAIGWFGMKNFGLLKYFVSDSITAIFNKSHQFKIDFEYV